MYYRILLLRINYIKFSTHNLILPFSEAHERELKELGARLADLNRQKEGVIREAAELATQLKLVEETRDAIRRDLIEANRAIREGQSLIIVSTVL